MEKEKILMKKAAEIRKSLLKVIYDAGTGHTGGALSCADILTVLYYDVLRINPAAPDDPSRDRFVLSKGHSVEGYYAILADKGFFPREELKRFSTFKSRLIGHPSVKVPGVELNTGALGHGLSCSVGMALAAKKDKSDARVFCLMGDGEQAEGSVWEAAMAGAHFGLDNLTGIIDRNHLQISGNTEDVMALEKLSDKWKAFGWDVRNVDGHDVPALLEAFEGSGREGKPKMIIAETTKGKGVCYMEHEAGWHHGVPSDEEYSRAIGEINEFIKEM